MSPTDIVELVAFGLGLSGTIWKFAQLTQRLESAAKEVEELKKKHEVHHDKLVRMETLLVKAPGGEPSGPFGKLPE